MAQINFGYTNITTNATTTLATKGPTTLHAIIVNNPGTTWVVTVYDNNAGSGTKIGTITGPIAGGNYIYDVDCANGLTIVTTGATPGDITVSFG